MKPSAFEYVRPAALPDALAALAASDGATPMAGGQSLLVLLRLRLASAETVVDIARLPELTGAVPIASGIRFGAALTHAAFEDGVVPEPSLGLMRQVASGIAYRAVRNLGTIGGSLALADPAADWPPCLLALEATVLIRGPDGERRMQIDAFIVGTYTTDLRPGELITGIEVSALPPGSRWGHVKLARKQGAYADSLAVAVWPAGATPRIVLGATRDRPRLLPRVSAALASDPEMVERSLSPALAADVAEVDPDADTYRRRCHEATMRRAIRQMRAR